MLLPTVRSRCQRLRFGRLSPADVAAVLVREHDCTHTDAHAAASMSDGSIGLALEGGSEAFVEARQAAAELLETAALSDDPRRRLEGAKALSAARAQQRSGRTGAPVARAGVHSPGSGCPAFPRGRTLSRECRSSAAAPAAAAVVRRRACASRVFSGRPGAFGARSECKPETRRRLACVSDLASAAVRLKSARSNARVVPFIYRGRHEFRAPTPARQREILSGWPHLLVSSPRTRPRSDGIPIAPGAEGPAARTTATPAPMRPGDAGHRADRRRRVRSGRVARAVAALAERKAPPGDSDLQVVRRATRDDIVQRLKQQQREQDAQRDRAAEDPRARAGDEADAGRAVVRRLAADLLLHRRRRASISASWCAIWRRTSGCGSRCARSACATRRKMLGGYGSCGRPLCCTTFLQTFEPISIKMAKQQNLSLNPSKLSGMCGRLKCCLRYELPNGKGVKHGGCADEGAAVLQQSDRPGRQRRRLRLLRSGRLWEVRVSDRPRIGVTVGDPSGIGPEIARKAAADPALSSVVRNCSIRSSREADLAQFERGQVSAKSGRAAFDAIVEATRDAQAGRIDAVATAPINKEAFAAAGLPWRGDIGSARAPDRHAPRGDDVLRRVAAGRARDRAHRDRPRCHAR